MDETAQFSLQFSPASIKCYLNTAWGFMVHVLREESKEKVKIVGLIKVSFNPIYKYKCYHCVHVRSASCGVMVL